jgi:hypothetical protein
MVATEKPRMARKSNRIPTRLQAERLRAALLLECCSAPVAEAQVTGSVETVDGKVVAELYLHTPEPLADTLDCRRIRCPGCGRLVPSVYLVREVCSDCAIDSGPAADVFGPSPLHISLEALRAFNIRLRW